MTDSIYRGTLEAELDDQDWGNVHSETEELTSKDFIKLYTWRIGAYLTNKETPGKPEGKKKLSSCCLTVQC